MSIFSELGLWTILMGFSLIIIGLLLTMIKNSKDEPLSIWKMFVGVGILLVILGIVSSILVTAEQNKTKIAIKESKADMTEYLASV